MKGIRESGIDLLGNFTWGAHFAQIYQSKEEYLELIIPYIEAGLRNNELCVWVYASDEDCLYIKEAMTKEIPFLNERLERGQLLLIPFTEFYSERGSFSHLYVLNNWSNMIHHALRNGFDGLRLTGDTAWADQESLSAIMEYDHTLDSAIANLPVVVACLFYRGNMDIFDLAKVIGNHNYVISKQNGKFEVIRNMKLLVKDEQIHKSMENYFRLIQHLPVAVFIHDAEKIYYCNQSAVELTGVKDTHELLRMDITSLQPEQTKHTFREFVKKTLNNWNKPEYFTTTINCVNGVVKPIIPSGSNACRVFRYLRLTSMLM